MTVLKKTPLNSVHRRLNAKMVDFGGWDMPVQYPSGIIAEHLLVRTKVGLFDVSHMGEIRVIGHQAMDFVDWLTPNNVRKLSNGQIHYTALLYEDGTFIDDLLLHKISDTEFLFVVNASNIHKDLQWIKRHAHKWDVNVIDESDVTGQVALQGPLSKQVIKSLVDVDIDSIKYYWFKFGHFMNIPVMIARTGYTGEDGYEIYCETSKTEIIWNTLIDKGHKYGLMPTGLGCRNTLRLEAKMALYGHEISDDINALEADLGWIVKFDKGDFIGRDALMQIKGNSLSRKLVGFKMLNRQNIARDNMRIIDDSGRAIGHVTSGAPSVTCACNLGLGYVPLKYSHIGNHINIDIRGAACVAEVVPTPFYKRK